VTDISWRKDQLQVFYQKAAILEASALIRVSLTGTCANTLRKRTEDGAKMVAVRVDTKPDEAIP